MYITYPLPLVAAYISDVQHQDLGQNRTVRMQTSCLPRRGNFPFLQVVPPFLSRNPQLHSSNNKHFTPVHLRMRCLLSATTYFVPHISANSPASMNVHIVIMILCIVAIGLKDNTQNKEKPGYDRCHTYINSETATNRQNSTKTAFANAMHARLLDTMLLL